MTGIYVHLPFCGVRCTYCPFAISTDLSRERAYTDALLREIGARATGEEAGSVYFGGGTPSRTPLASLERIAGALRERFRIRTDAEFSMEANPEDVTPQALRAWMALGVNRISIGVQSFHDAELRPLGRLHTARQARDAVEAAVAAGIRTNLDLIAGLPNQSQESFAATLETALATGVGHLSLYMLDLEERTPLQVQVARGRTTLPDDEAVAAMYRHAVVRLAEGGLGQYEISNFARPGEECRHNLRYWERRPYHGFGLGAHSFLGEERFANTRNIADYIDRPEDATDFREVLGEGERRREEIFLGLRQTRGIWYDALLEICGQEGEEWLDRGLREGWLRREGGRVAFTTSGFLLSNDYISQLF
ncbi:MAG TPA: radical SAM family heme chaperone HemW [Thermoanaerobaculia bacterium]|nr:radical SAM family heme chaperone HemW [Thermoanaerobaculia bacterium]